MRVTIRKGHRFNLIGEAVKAGDVAPNFEVVSSDFSNIKLSDFQGKVVVINSVPSIDTPVCNRQIVSFNQEAALLHDAIILSVSMDLPFALKRFCGTYGINNVKMASDYKNLDFSKKYGTLIEELQILSRAVFVINKDGFVHYAEYVQDSRDLPDFDKALAAVHQCS